MSSDPGPTSSSGSSERFTVAYAETPAIADRDSRDALSSVYNSSSSSSLDTPRSEQSFTSLFDELTEAKQRAEFFGYEPRRSAASLCDGPRLDGLEYFWSHSIFQLLCFLMSHLLARAPDSPAAFLRELVDRCLRYRDRGAAPPLLFDEPHVRSVYTSLDPGGDGRIKYTQYVTGMKTLGLTEFNLLPGEVEFAGNDVEKELFVAEARRALLSQLDAMLGPSAPAASTDGGGGSSEGGGPEAGVWAGAEDPADMTSEQIMGRWRTSGRSVGRGSPSSNQLVTRFARADGYVSSRSSGSAGAGLGAPSDLGGPSSAGSRSSGAGAGGPKEFVSAGPSKTPHTSQRASFSLKTRRSAPGGGTVETPIKEELGSVG